MKHQKHRHIPRHIGYPTIPRIINKARPLPHPHPLPRYPTLLLLCSLLIILIQNLIVEARHTIRYEPLIREIPHKTRKLIKILTIEHIVIYEIGEVVYEGIDLADFEEYYEVGGGDHVE